MYSNAMKRAAVLGSLVLTACLIANPVSARRAMGTGLDAQLGVRFLTPVTASMSPGSQVDALVTSPEKLLGLGLGSVKRGDRVTLVKGAQGDEFSVKHGGQTVPLTVGSEGSVRAIIVQGGLINTPAVSGAPANSIILQGGKASKGPGK
jgi:hypothetical protein